MPTYEYECKACGRKHEIFQKITDNALTECPACHQPALSKLISGGNFQLKGTGWYVTDIRDKGKKKPEPAESGSGSSGSTSSEKKSDTKSSDSSNSGTGTT